MAPRLEIQSEIIKLFRRDLCLPFCVWVGLGFSICFISFITLFCAAQSESSELSGTGLKGKMKIAFLSHKKWEVKQPRQEG